MKLVWKKDVIFLPRKILIYSAVIGYILLRIKKCLKNGIYVSNIVEKRLKETKKTGKTSTRTKTIQKDEGKKKGKKEAKKPSM